MVALVAGVAAALVVSGLIRLVTHDDGKNSDTPGAATRATTGSPTGSSTAIAARESARREAATSALLRELERALEDGDVRAARALAGPPEARRLAAGLVRNVERLDVAGLDLRRTAEAPATADLVSRFGERTWVADVQVSWRYAGIDRRAVSSTAQLVLTPTAEGAVLDATRPSDAEQAPGWFLEPLAAVRRAARVRVTAPRATTAARLLTLASRALTVVGRRLPAWRGDLVVEASGSADGFRAASGVGLAAARTIAAVTTTADGSTLPGSPERVFVNPRVFDPLGAAGQQIVLSHEATHVALDAAVSPMPPWLSEGFADWVALADSRVPVRVLASQALAQIREGRVPSHLPRRADFAAGSADLGAAYESAWLAVRLIARTWGEAAVLRFQHAVDAQVSTEQAFRTTLGTTREAFTHAWRRELVRLAG